ncbi:hypothetical protein [Egicoccus sp. AB-alg2]|uniref:hypothetical protein n=1 Tax=Egicoccus sp. AB-alg2 TaxID=3242693 RepID=UPI00359EDD2B
MTTTRVPELTRRHPTAANRAGYVVAIAVNGLLLWVAGRLLDWGWPGFLTEDFTEVLPLLTVSLVAGMLANAAFLVRDRGAFRALADLVTTTVGLAVAVRLWDVFPFDFAGYPQDWSWLVRVGLAVGIVGGTIAIVVNLVRLVRCGLGGASDT